MIKEINLDCTQICYNGLNCDGKNQVDDLKRWPKDLTFNSEMEQFTDCELDFLSTFFFWNFGFEIVFFSELDGIISSEK